jgi:hypothetical protein
MHRTRVWFAFASASGQTLTRKIGQNISVVWVTVFEGGWRATFIRLVWDSTDVTTVIGVWPLEKSQRNDANL